MQPVIQATVTTEAFATQVTAERGIEDEVDDIVRSVNSFKYNLEDVTKSEDMIKGVEESEKEMTEFDENTRKKIETVEIMLKETEQKGETEKVEKVRQQLDQVKVCNWYFAVNV